MKFVAALLCGVLVPGLAAAQAASYKLVIASSEGGMTVIEYSSFARCQQAKAAIEAEMRRRTSEADARREPGAIIVDYGFRAYAFCVPG